LSEQKSELMMHQTPTKY